jgi:glucoamylase
MGALQYSLVKRALAPANLTTVGQYMFWLMFRNIASDGLVFEDPVNAGVLSQPGCVLASPSWENSATRVRQDYVYNWTRDAAIVAIELAESWKPLMKSKMKATTTIAAM